MPHSQDDPYYCALLHKGLYLEKTTSEDFAVASCCAMHRGTRTSQIDFVNNAWLQEKRSLSRQERIPECKQCWDLEQATGHSHRIGANQWLDRMGDDIDPYAAELLRFDYNVDILCNAKCIQCSSWFSSLWAAEDQQHGIKQQPRYFNVIRKNTFDSVDVSKLVHVYFNGGEPFLSDQPEEFLTKIKDQKGLETVTVDFSTNGSVMPRQSLIDLLKQCKRASLIISLDGVNGAFEYIRHPLVWAEVEANAVRMTELADNIVIGFSNNIGVHNIDEVINMKKWYDDISRSVRFCGMGFMQTVQTLALDNASRALLDLWKEKFMPMAQHDPVFRDIAGMVLNARGRDDDHIWLDHLSMIDRRRDLDWRSALPNLHDSYKKIQDHSDPVKYPR